MTNSSKAVAIKMQMKLKTSFKHNLKFINWSRIVYVVKDVVSMAYAMQFIEWEYSGQRFEHRPTE